MTAQPAAGIDPTFVAYVVVFAATAVACFASVRPVRSLDDPDTRRGLTALLVASGAWAAAHVGFLTAPGEPLKLLFYHVGLIIGLGTVGPWLYFCSAYTGRSLHRNPTYRRVAVGVYLAIVVVKLTNPLHNLYFTAAAATEPFPHLAVELGAVHWLVMGLAYALATVGYFMLFELFEQVSYDTTPLIALVGVTGLPIALDVVGLVSPFLVDITYEPLGVAAFAVGFAFLFLEEFRTVQVAGGRDEPVIVLDDDGRVREFNDGAAGLFPELDGGALDRPLGEVLPAVEEAVGADPPILAVDRDGGTRYYRVSESPFTAGHARLGRLLTVTDITERERYRRELERQNERLEEFASMVSHDLRNPLNVAKGRVELAGVEGNGNLETAADALDRMEVLIEDVLALARQGQPIDETETVGLSALAEESWGMVSAADADLTIEGDIDLEADPERLRQLLENLFRNAVDHGGDGVTVRVGAFDGGFYVEDDGPGIPEEERDRVFESGFTTDDEGTGFGLSIVEEIVDAHGWTIRATEGEAGGARFEITAPGSR